MKARFFCTVGLCAALITSCGILGNKFVDYQAVGPVGGGGGAALIPFCQAASDAVSTAFAAGCSCHSSTAPVFAFNPDQDRLAMLALVDSKYAGDIRDFVAYLKTDHSGSTAIPAPDQLGLDDWATSEQDTTICDKPAPEGAATP